MQLDLLTESFFRMTPLRTGAVKEDAETGHVASGVKEGTLIVLKVAAVLRVAVVQRGATVGTVATVGRASEEGAAGPDLQGIPAEEAEKKSDKRATQSLLRTANKYVVIAFS